jgi:hypothetical protein
LQTAGELDTANNTWIIKGHKPNYDKKSLEEIEWLEKEILNYGENKPVLSELEEKGSNRNIPKHKIQILPDFSGRKRENTVFQIRVHTHRHSEKIQGTGSEPAGRE